MAIIVDDRSIVRWRRHVLIGCVLTFVLTCGSGFWVYFMIEASVLDWKQEHSQQQAEAQPGLTWILINNTIVALFSVATLILSVIAAVIGFVAALKNNKRGLKIFIGITMSTIVLKIITFIDAAVVGTIISRYPAYHGYMDIFGINIFFTVLYIVLAIVITPAIKAWVVFCAGKQLTSIYRHDESMDVLKQHLYTGSPLEVNELGSIGDYTAALHNEGGALPSAPSSSLDSSPLRNGPRQSASDHSSVNNIIPTKKNNNRIHSRLHSVSSTASTSSERRTTAEQPYSSYQPELFSAAAAAATTVGGSNLVSPRRHASVARIERPSNAYFMLLFDQQHPQPQPQQR